MELDETYRFCPHCQTDAYHDITTMDTRHPKTTFGRFVLGVMTLGVSEIIRKPATRCHKYRKKYRL